MDDYKHLQGRIIALELIVRALLAEQATRSSRPLAHAKHLQSQFLGSLQHLQRESGIEEDEIWVQAADAMREQFAQVVQRVTHAQESGQIPRDKE